MRRKTIKITVFVLIPILMLLGLLAWRSSRQPSLDTLYHTQRVINNQLRVAVSATGSLKPVLVVSVGTQVSGTVKDILVDYNDEVSEGQLLLILDEDLFKAKSAQSRAGLSSVQAKMTLADLKASRYRRLYETRAVTQEELDQVEADLAVARAAVDQAQAQLDIDDYNLRNARIVSPVNGVVIDREVEIGQTVAASFQTPTLIQIAQDLTQMQIEANFAEADVGRLQTGLKATFQVDAYPGRVFEGVLRQVRLNPTTEQNVVTYNVVIDVANPDQTLLPGMTAYVDIELHKEGQALLVPNTALNYHPSDETLRPAEGQGSGVYLLRGSKVVWVPFKPGATDLRHTVVASGDLKEGDLVIVRENTPASGRPGAQMPRGPRF